jgi:hypothetical protein
VKRAVVVLVLLLGGVAHAHVGSPDVFFDGDAGPYALFVTVRMPEVIPGVATIEVRAPDDVTGMSVVPMRLSGPGSELPPTPDIAERSPDDARFYTAQLWLMEHGSLQVRIAVDGARGKGVLAVPIPAVAQRTLGMDRTLGAVLLGLMLVLALSLVSIAGAAVREGGLDPGVEPTPRTRRIARVAIIVASGVVVFALWGGNAWWRSEAADYEDMVARPWHVEPVRDGCELKIPAVDYNLMLDHGHELHVFVVRTAAVPTTDRDTGVRTPELDRLAHLHPARTERGYYIERLPLLPAGHYAVFVDAVLEGGFPLTGTGDLDLPDLSACAPVADDDAMWSGETTSDVVLDPPQRTANVAQSLHLRITGGGDLLPYMGMAGHAIIVKRDLSVYAHLHPYGSVAMPALMLAKAPHDMFAPERVLPPDVHFPYAFPQPGAYRLFIQLRRRTGIETAVFDVNID